MKAYKLLDQNMQAHQGFQYELNKPIVFAEQPVLCGENCLHFYDDPILAIMFNPIHSDIKNPRMFIGDTLDGIILNDKNVKFGSNQLVITEEIELPKITLVNRVAFGILCSKQVMNDSKWIKWADDWLNNIDRGKQSAYATRAAAAAYAAAYAADAYTAAAAYAADAAAAAAAAARARKSLNLSDIAQQAMLIV